MEYLDEYNLFNNNQHGFRKGRSCLSQLLAHYDNILKDMESGAGADVVYLDFCKAFDKVDFEVLLKKIKSLGIGGKIGRWIYSFLTNRTQTVIVNSAKSEPADVRSGVPQGSVLGPLLFVILISDIDTVTKHTRVRCFADDTRVSKTIKEDKDITEMQSDLNNIYHWSNTNKMKFNETKFELIRYKSQQTQHLQIASSYNTNTLLPIEEKEKVKDLGVKMTNDASFKVQIDEVASKLKNLAAWILRTFESRGKNVMLTTWKTLALPIHDNCSQLWNPYTAGEINKLEQVQRSFLRKILDNAGGDYWERLKKFKMLSLQRRRERYIILYIHKILSNRVPNLDDTDPGSGITLKSSTQPSRRGYEVQVPSINSKAPQNIKTKIFNSFAVKGPRLYNLLPSNLRNMVNKPTETFKRRLDAFLQTIPDQPQLPGYKAHCFTISNSLIEMIPHRNQTSSTRESTLSEREEGGSPMTP